MKTRLLGAQSAREPTVPKKNSNIVGSDANDHNISSGENLHRSRTRLTKSTKVHTQCDARNQHEVNANINRCNVRRSVRIDLKAKRATPLKNKSKHQKNIRKIGKPAETKNDLSNEDSKEFARKIMDTAKVLPSNNDAKGSKLIKDKQRNTLQIETRGSNGILSMDVSQNDKNAAIPCDNTSLVDAKMPTDTNTNNNEKIPNTRVRDCKRMVTTKIKTNKIKRRKEDNQNENKSEKSCTESTLPNQTQNVGPCSSNSKSYDDDQSELGTVTAVTCWMCNQFVQNSNNLRKDDRSERVYSLDSPLMFLPRPESNEGTKGFVKSAERYLNLRFKMPANSEPNVCDSCSASMHNYSYMVWAWENIQIQLDRYTIEIRDAMMRETPLGEEGLKTKYTMDRNVSVSNIPNEHLAMMNEFKAEFLRKGPAKLYPQIVLRRLAIPTSKTPNLQNLKTGESEQVTNVQETTHLVVGRVETETTEERNISAILDENFCKSIQTQDEKNYDVRSCKSIQTEIDHKNNPHNSNENTSVQTEIDEGKSIESRSVQTEIDEGKSIESRSVQTEIDEGKYTVNKSVQAEIDEGKYSENKSVQTEVDEGKSTENKSVQTEKGEDKSTETETNKQTKRVEKQQLSQTNQIESFGGSSSGLTLRHGSQHYCCRYFPFVQPIEMGTTGLRLCHCKSRRKRKKHLNKKPNQPLLLSPSASEIECVDLCLDSDEEKKIGETNEPTSQPLSFQNDTESSDLSVRLVDTIQQVSPKYCLDNNTVTNQVSTSATIDSIAIDELIYSLSSLSPSLPEFTPGTTECASPFPHNNDSLISPGSIGSVITESVSSPEYIDCMRNEMRPSPDQESFDDLLVLPDEQNESSVLNDESMCSEPPYLQQEHLLVAVDIISSIEHSCVAASVVTDPEPLAFSSESSELNYALTEIDSCIVFTSETCDVSLGETSLCFTSTGEESLAEHPDTDDNPNSNQAINTDFEQTVFPANNSEELGVHLTLSSPQLGPEIEDNFCPEVTNYARNDGNEPPEFTEAIPISTQQHLVTPDDISDFSCLEDSNENESQIPSAYSQSIFASQNNPQTGTPSQQTQYISSQLSPAETSLSPSGFEVTSQKIPPPPPQPLFNFFVGQTNFYPEFTSAPFRATPLSEQCSDFQVSQVYSQSCLNATNFLNHGGVGHNGEGIIEAVASDLPEVIQTLGVSQLPIITDPDNQTCKSTTQTEIVEHGVSISEIEAGDGHAKDAETVNDISILIQSKRSNVGINKNDSPYQLRSRSRKCKLTKSGIL